MSSSLQPHGLQQARLPCPSPTPGAYSNSCPLSQWCHLTISSSVVPFTSCPQSLPASESFPMSQVFTWGGQSTGVSALASFPPKKSQGWSPSEWTGWISLQSKGLSRVFSNTTVWKHQFFSTQLSSQSNSHIHYLGFIINRQHITPQLTQIHTDKLSTLNIFQKLLGDRNKIRSSLDIANFQLTNLFHTLKRDPDLNSPHSFFTRDTRKTLFQFTSLQSLSLV